MVHSWIILIAAILGIATVTSEIYKARKLSAKELSEKINVKELYMSHRITYTIIFIAMLIASLCEILGVNI